VELIALPSATSSAFAVRIDRANATWCRRAENASRNRFAMIGQQSLPQLVVYGNPARGGATTGRKRSYLQILGVGCSFGLESTPNSIFIKLK